MTHRISFGILFTLLLLGANFVFAADDVLEGKKVIVEGKQKVIVGQTRDGAVVVEDFTGDLGWRIAAVRDGRMVVKNKNGLGYMYKVATGAQVTVDGVPSKLTLVPINSLLNELTVERMQNASYQVTAVSALTPETPEVDVVEQTWTVAEIGEANLVVVDADRKRSTYVLGKDTAILLEGKAGRLSDLRRGAKVRLKLQKAADGTEYVTHIHSGALVSAEPADLTNARAWKVTSTDNELLTVTDIDSHKQFTFLVAPDAAISREGKECRLEDLRRNDLLEKATVTRLTDGSYRATQIAVSHKVAVEPLPSTTQTTEPAPEKPAPPEGYVIAAGRLVLVITDRVGEVRYNHHVSENAKITLNGKAVKLENLREGYHVKVKSEKAKDGKEVAVEIAATSKDVVTAKTIKGKIIAAEVDKLVVADADGLSHTYTIGDKTVLMLDGKVRKLSELPNGGEVEVTVDKDDDGNVTVKEVIAATKSKAQ